MNKLARLIAFYLPQYHPIPENDKWWGRDFTEWSNVKKAKPLFSGHCQPRIPSELGYYDLRNPEVRQAQADLAREHGIEGFCYWHYWFGNGKRILERPFQEVLRSGKPDLPFCLAWANQSWTGIWHAAPDRLLIEQSYPGQKDYEQHFYAIKEALLDKRYITVDSKKLFIIYEALKDNLTNISRFIEAWRALALKEGVGEFFFVGFTSEENAPMILESGFDAYLGHLPGYEMSKIMDHCENLNPFAFFKLFNIRRLKLYGKKQNLMVYRYKDIVDAGQAVPVDSRHIPVVLPNWDNTPRCGYQGVVWHDSTPELFRKFLEKAITQVKNKPPEHKIIFIKSWNEWGEGNYVEPDQRFGRGYLEAARDAVSPARA